jgi:glycine cleavage system aminomethyltransferase T
VVYTQFLNEQGGIVSDVTVTRLGEERFRVVTGAGTVDSDLGWLRLNVRDGDDSVGLREASEELSVVGIWGPQARDVLQSVTADDVSAEAIPFRRARMIRAEGAEILAQRITYVGELGFELYVEPEWAVQLWDRLVEAGEPHRITPGGYRVLDSLRMEKGYRYLGTDLTGGDTPFEAGLGFCVADSKGEFNGRAALEEKRVPVRRLRTLLVGEEEYLPVYGGEAVHMGGDVAGRIRSAAYGFTVGRNLAFAYLPAEVCEGDEAKVEIFGDLVAATVAADALYDPSNERILA